MTAPARGRHTPRPSAAPTASDPVLVADRRDTGADEQVELAPGALVLDRYRLERRLGSGGFGEVWRATDQRLGRRVALKAIPGGAGQGARGAREALAAARLAHPAIVALFEAVDAGDTAFLVSELVEGRTLAALERSGALSDRDVARVGLALCAALAHAHAHGVVHRDVKPQNVLIPAGAHRGEAGPAAAAKLTDFGVAHLVGDDPLTRTGDVLGTLAYMAPEQASGHRVDGRADLYALGLVLHEALAGAHPSRAEGPAAALRRLGAPLPALRRSRRDLPRALCAAIDRATAPDPGMRGTIADLAAALEDALPGLSDRDGVIAPGPWEGLPARRLLGMAPLAWTVLGGLALAATWLITIRPVPHPGIPAAALLAILAAALCLLPRLSWLGAVSAALVWTAVGPPKAPGLALVLGAGLLPAPLLLPRAAPAWPLPAVAGMLAAVGLGPAATVLASWTAVGRARRVPAAAAGRWHARLRAGALAAWGASVAGVLAGRGLGAGPAGAPDAGWMVSAATGGHVLLGLLGPPLLVVVVCWSLAAMLLPLAVRASSVWGLSGGVATWAVALVMGSTSLSRIVGAPPVGAAAGAAVAGLIAIIVTLMSFAPPNPEPAGGSIAPPAGPRAVA